MLEDSRPPLQRLIIPLLLILLGVGLRAQLLHADVRFHPDEAYFAAFARDAVVRGEWWLSGDLDKPPLAIYGQALMMLVTGIEWDGAVWRLDVLHGEFSARLWSFYAGVLLMPTVYALARRLYRDVGTAQWALALVALSPYLIAFSPTAFTDTPMLLGVLWAVLLAVRGQAGLAALAWVLALGTKPQALLFAPLIVALIGMQSARGLWRALGVTVSGLGALLLWDVLRPFPSVWALGTVNNAPSSLWVTWSDIVPRGVTWASWLRYAFGGVWLTLALTLFGLGSRWTRARLMLAAFLIGYGLLHWLIPVNIYDRYVLAIVPLWALVIVGCRWRWVRGVLLIGLLWGAIGTANGHAVIGGDKGDMHGIDTLADYLNEREFGAIVYDRWLGWPLNYYLGGWSDKRRAYYPTPDEMTQDPALTVHDVAPRYFPMPRDVDASAWLAALESAGFAVSVGYESPQFVVIVLQEADVSHFAEP